MPIPTHETLFKDVRYAVNVSSFIVVSAKLVGKDILLYDAVETMPLRWEASLFLPVGTGLAKLARTKTV